MPHSEFSESIAVMQQLYTEFMLFWIRFLAARKLANKQFAYFWPQDHKSTIQIRASPTERRISDA
jgi:hypothetical protein